VNTAGMAVECASNYYSNYYYTQQ